MITSVQESSSVGSKIPLLKTRQLFTLRKIHLIPRHLTNWPIDQCLQKRLQQLVHPAFFNSHIRRALITLSSSSSSLLFSTFQSVKFYQLFFEPLPLFFCWIFCRIYRISYILSVSACTTLGVCPQEKSHVNYTRRPCFTTQCLNQLLEQQPKCTTKNKKQRLELSTSFFNSPQQQQLQLRVIQLIYSHCVRQKKLAKLSPCIFQLFRNVLPIKAAAAASIPFMNLVVLESRPFKFN